MNKNLFSAIAGVCLSISSANSMASYINYGNQQDFTFVGTPSVWLPGANTASLKGANLPAPGGATWSIIAPGVSDSASNGADGSHNEIIPATDSDPATILVHQTTDISGLVPSISSEDITNIFNSALDTWAAVSGFTNLGQVPDGGAVFGADQVDAGHLGDIRFGAIFIDGGTGSNTLAHAFQPGTQAIFNNGNIGGDVHFDNSNTWVDDANAVGQVDLYTVALHEIGHALGLGHSTVSGSVMEAIYAGGRRNLTNDDIDGIHALYGPAVATVPVPAPIVLFLSGLTALRLYSRKK